MTSAASASSPRPASGVRRTRGAGVQLGSQTSLYSDLLKTVRDAGYLRRTHAFYGITFAALLVALGGVITGFILLGDTWYQLLMAGALGVLTTQFAFLAHEAAHRQIFSSNQANDWIGRVLGTFFVGMSYTWWMHKHSRHHAQPNTIGKDPDIAPGPWVTFTEEDSAARRGFSAWISRRQGWLLFFFLMFLGFDLQRQSFMTLLGRGKVEHRFLELGLLLLRIGGLATVVFLTLPLGMAFAFLGVTWAVWGVYMGSSFATNHKGMPTIPHDSKIDFFSRQLITSRNVKGGWWATALFGGLNRQTEHHLFPNMPRPHLSKVTDIVREYATKHAVPFTEMSFGASYVAVVKHLNRVGLFANEPIPCPISATYRTHR